MEALVFGMIGFEKLTKTRKGREIGIGLRRYLTSFEEGLDMGILVRYPRSWTQYIYI